jgi:hypothetical protein
MNFAISQRRSNMYRLKPYSDMPDYIRDTKLDRLLPKSKFREIVRNVFYVPRPTFKRKVPFVKRYPDAFESEQNENKN